jgi:hypothetical protein
VEKVSALARKLRLKPGFRAIFLNAPEGYLDRLRPLPADVDVVTGDDGRLEFLQLFVRDVAELRELGGRGVRRVRPEGVLWVTYTKSGVGNGATDLPATPWWRRRDVLGEITGEWGLAVMALVSLDETWTALRFKPRG